jgi:ABC-2 type transport system ATP-binding protein
MIRIENLTKKFGDVRALQGLSLEVQTGAIYGFLGPNGAGKTTTLRILSGLAKLDRGSAWIMGKEVRQTNVEQRASFGYLPEEPSFYTWMTPNEYLSNLVAPLYGIRGEAARKRTSEILEQTGLSYAARRRIAGFSRGMRQRLGLAQALIHRPPVLLLDEPVSALDPAGRKDILELIESLRGTTTVLFSTHILSDVERICDTIGIIANGRLVVQEDRQVLLDRYAIPAIEVESDYDLAAWSEEAKSLSYVENISQSDASFRLVVSDLRMAQADLLASLAAQGVPLRRFEVVHPNLEDVFLRLTGPEHTGGDSTESERGYV